MTITNLKKIIAHYHSQGSMLKVPADFIISGGPDLILQALNNARKEAEQLHDLESSYVFADLVVDEVAGGALSACKLHGTNTAVKMKTIDTMGRFTIEGSFFQVPWQKVKGYRRDQRLRDDVYNEYDPDYRVPSDGTYDSRFAESSIENRVVVYGQQVYIKPAGTAGTNATVGIEGWRWLDDYTDATADNADVFLEHGYNYLQWAGVCELNYLLRKFAPREEGNIPPPLREKQSALESFIRWDTFSNAGVNQ